MAVVVNKLLVGRVLCPIVLASLVTACASQMPEPLREDISAMPGIAEVRSDIASHIGQRVRWGGSIRSVQNQQTETQLEIVGRPLDEDSARPERGDASPGRFIAIVPGFLEPAIYGNGREITVLGTIHGEETRTVDEFSYRYPVVAVDSHHLWKPFVESRYRDYDPFWDPYWGVYPFGSYWHYRLYHPIYYERATKDDD
jgi:outer membrane lipoprotein